MMLPWRKGCGEMGTLVPDLAHGARSASGATDSNRTTAIGRPLLIGPAQIRAAALTQMALSGHERVEAPSGQGWRMRGPEIPPVEQWRERIRQYLAKRCLPSLGRRDNVSFSTSSLVTGSRYRLPVSQMLPFIAPTWLCG